MFTCAINRSRYRASYPPHTSSKTSEHQKAPDLLCAYLKNRGEEETATNPSKNQQEELIINKKKQKVAASGGAGARPREAPVAAARGRRHRSRTCPSSTTGLAGAAGRQAGGWLLGQVNTAGSGREVGDDPQPQEARACPSTRPRGESVNPRAPRFPRSRSNGPGGIEWERTAEILTRQPMTVRPYTTPTWGRRR